MSSLPWLDDCLRVEIIVKGYLLGPYVLQDTEDKLLKMALKIVGINKVVMVFPVFAAFGFSLPHALRAIHYDVDAEDESKVCTFVALGVVRFDGFELEAGIRLLRDSLKTLFELCNNIIFHNFVVLDCIFFLLFVLEEVSGLLFFDCPVGTGMCTQGEEYRKEVAVQCECDE